MIWPAPRHGRRRLGNEQPGRSRQPPTSAASSTRFLRTLNNLISSLEPRSTPSGRPRGTATTLGTTRSKWQRSSPWPTTGHEKSSNSVTVPDRRRSSLPAFSILNDTQQPAMVRNNLRLLYGQWWLNTVTMTNRSRCSTDWHQKMSLIPQHCFFTRVPVTSHARQETLLADRGQVTGKRTTDPTSVCHRRPIDPSRSWSP